MWSRASDGDEALRLASLKAPGRVASFDLILMDLKMPGLDGYETTRRLRRLEAACGWPPTPVVALTANALDDDRRSCLAAGFDAFLVKPFDFRELAGTIERVCAGRRRNRPQALPGVIGRAGSTARGIARTDGNSHPRGIRLMEMRGRAAAGD